MTKVDTADSFIHPAIGTSDDCINDGIYSYQQLPLGIYIDVEFDARAETTTPNKGDVPDEGKHSDVPRSKQQIRRKITRTHQVNLDRPVWLPQNWKFETMFVPLEPQQGQQINSILNRYPRVNLGQRLRWKTSQKQVVSAIGKELTKIMTGLHHLRNKGMLIHCVNYNNNKSNQS